MLKNTSFIKKFVEVKSPNFKPPLVHHKQISVIDPTGEKFNCDVKILPLIEKLWRRELKTIFSCEGTLGSKYLKAYVTLLADSKSEEFLKFLKKESFFKSSEFIDFRNQEICWSVDNEATIELFNSLGFETYIIRFGTDRLEELTNLL